MSYPVRQFIVNKTPFRISLGGGGTDLPFYSSERGGFLITASINQYIMVSTAMRMLTSDILIQTTDVQFANELGDVDHGIIRESLRYFGFTKQVQVATFATVPTGIGIGSSSSLAVGLVHSLMTMRGKSMTDMEVGETAHKIERVILGLPGGVQDQYIAALGGIQILKISTSGQVSAEALQISVVNRQELERGLVLIYSGQNRSSIEIIESQRVAESRMFEVYDTIKEIGREAIDFLRSGDVEGLGRGMDDHWQLKKQLSPQMSNSHLDDIYIKLKELGASGGKIVGAGGGGLFLMAVAGDVRKYIDKIDELGFRRLSWQFEFHGTHTIDQS